MDRKTAEAALDTGFIHTLRDPLWKDIGLDDAFRHLYLEKNVQKLANIKQNGPACNIYPGAVHTRLIHSLGVYHVGRLIMKKLCMTGGEDFTYTGIRSFLAACLLHDIGHFPYAHSLKELSIREHEDLACDLIDGDASLNKAVRQCGADPETVKQIISKRNIENRETEIYSSLLSGALDPDKLDYLNRDAFFAGVPYGLQDTGYIISSMRLENGKPALVREAISSLEHLLFSKYLMYRNVYWHKGVRSATAMIKKALLEGMRDGIISCSDLYFIDDNQFSLFPQIHEGYEPFRLITKVFSNQLLSRVYEKPYEEGGRIETQAADLFRRLEIENSLYEELKKHYPDLKEYEVVIDIQEPVSFESSTMILSDEGALPFSEVTQLFTKDVNRQFTSSLRNVSLYAPQYVSDKLASGIINEYTGQA